MHRLDVHSRLAGDITVIEDTAAAERRDPQELGKKICFQKINVMTVALLPTATLLNIYAIMLLQTEKHSSKKS